MEREKILLIVGIGLIVVAVLMLVGWIYLLQNFLKTEPTESIDSFEKCAAAGYPVMESYPRQCQTPDGRTFIEEVAPPEEPVCQDLCGDGVCQEIVCLAIGCPCPETAESCPEDCAKVDVSDWQTYQNEEYGFEFKYPKGRVVEILVLPYYYSDKSVGIKLQGYVNGIKNIKSEIVVIMYGGIDDFNKVNKEKIGTNWESFDDFAENTKRLENKQRINFASREAVRGQMSSEVGISSEIFVENNGHIYGINFDNFTFNDYERPEVKEDLRLQDQILSTFKFIK